METRLPAFLLCLLPILSGLVPPGSRRLERLLLFRQFVRCAPRCCSAMDGGYRFIRAQMGAEQHIAGGSSALEKNPSTLGHADHPVAAAAGIVDRTVRHLASSLARLPHLHRSYRHAPAWRLRIFAALRPGPVAGGLAPGITPRI